MHRGQSARCRFDGAGNIWFTGNPLGQFDPKTNEYTEVAEVDSAYDLKADHDGKIWFTKTGNPNAIGMVDYKTMKVSLWQPLTKNSFPRRLEVNASGIVWSGEFRSGKMLRFDPKTRDMKEFPLPGPQPTPYGLGVDAKGNVWYASYNMDVLGCFEIRRRERRWSIRSRIRRTRFAS